MIDLKELSAVLEEYAAEVKKEYIANLERDGRPASGKLINSITTSVRTGDREWVVTMDLEDYWKYIEYGTKGWYTGNPGRKFPPVNKLLEWINVKPGFPRPATLPERRSLAYLIGRKIQQFGTKGRADLTEAKMTVTERFRDRIAEALGHDMTDYIRKVLNE